MRSSYATLMQSKYFNPAFNSAIFDGPVRIYFAQFHEALALKIYFLIQQKLSAEMATARKLAKASGANILMMIYPTDAQFKESFESSDRELIDVEKWQENVVIGVRGPIEDENLDQLMETLRLSMNSWSPASLAATTALVQV